MFTGLHLPQHKLLSNRHSELDHSLRTLSGVARSAGYDTGAFVSVVFLRALARGFNLFEDAVGASVRTTSFAKVTVDRTLKWLSSKNPGDNFFAWVHLFDPHAPMLPPEPFQRQMASCDRKEEDQLFKYWTETQHKEIEGRPWNGDRGKFITYHHLYDAEIAYADAELRRLYNYCEERGFLKNSLWIVTADHGQGLGSHHAMEHTRRLYRELIHVPLLVHRPGWPEVAGVIDELVQHVDLLPTLAGLLGAPIEIDPAAEGISMAPLLRGDAQTWPQRFAFAYRAHKGTRPREYGRGDELLYTIHDRRFKYIALGTRREEYYDVAADPYELVDLAAKRPDALAAIREFAREKLAALTQSAESIEQPRQSAEFDEQLRALGYI